jgi:gas vesicle protein
MSDRESGGSSFTVGFIIGAIVGVAVGFLYAPKAGRETRALLKEKAGKVKEKASEIAGKTKEAAVEAGRAVRDKFASKEASD